MVMNEQQEKKLVQTMSQYRRKTRAFYACLLVVAVISGLGKMNWPTVVIIASLYLTYAGLISTEKLGNKFIDCWLKVKKGA